MFVELKSWFKSKTVWFFALYLLVNVAGMFGFNAYQPSAQGAEIVGIVVAIIGIILRLVTKQPLG